MDVGGFDRRSGGSADRRARGAMRGGSCILWAGLGTRVRSARWLLSGMGWSGFSVFDHFLQDYV